MSDLSLKFIESLYTDSELSENIAEFQDKGYTVLKDVFERESVPLFKAELEEIMYHNGLAYTIPDDQPHYIHAALAPRAKDREGLLKTKDSRFVLAYSSFGLPHFYRNTFHIPRFQMSHWINASELKDSVFLKGTLLSYS